MTHFRFAEGIPAWAWKDVARLELNEAKALAAEQDAADAGFCADLAQAKARSAELAACIARHPAGKDL